MLRICSRLGHQKGTTSSQLNLLRLKCTVFLFTCGPSGFATHCCQNPSHNPIRLIVYIRYTSALNTLQIIETLSILHLFHSGTDRELVWWGAGLLITIIIYNCNDLLRQNHEHNDGNYQACNLYYKFHKYIQ